MWDHLIEENVHKEGKKPKMAEEISMLRFHMGI
jgi:hypothetical protein